MNQEQIAAMDLKQQMLKALEDAGGIMTVRDLCNAVMTARNETTDNIEQFCRESGYEPDDILQLTGG